MAGLLMWLLSACVNSTSGLARSVPTLQPPTVAPVSPSAVDSATAMAEPAVASPAPANATVTANADLVSLLDYMKQRGIVPKNPHESRAALLYPVPGVAYEIDGEWLYVHPFPSVQAAEQRAKQMPPEMTPSVMDWVNKPHFYRCKSVIVLYLGVKTQITQALTEFCGGEFAGS